MQSRHGTTRATPVTPVSDTAWSLVEGLDDITVLVSPERDPADVVVDPILAKDFTEVLDDLAAHLGAPLADVPGALRQHVDAPIRHWVDDQVQQNAPLMEFDDSYGLVILMTDREGHEIGLAALRGDPMDGYKIRGLLFGADLVVDPLHRGMGLGSSLVAASLLYNESLPTWDHDEPGYSPAGEICVRRGLVLARNLAREFRPIEPDDHAAISI